MARQFFYKQMGEVLGPLTGQQLKQLADSGTIDGGTHVSTDRERWVLAEQVQGLFALQAEATPAVEPAPRENTRDLDNRWAMSPDASPPHRPATARPPRRTPVGRPARSPLARLIDMLDFRFERYLTPELIRLFWVVSLVLAAVSVCLSALGGLPYALPHRIQVENRLAFDTQRRMALIADLIEERERLQARKAAVAADAAPRAGFPQFDSAELPVAEPDPRAEYRALGGLTLDQLKAERARLEREFPTYRSEWVVRNSVIYVLTCVALLLVAVLALLVVRIVCEMLVVVFNIANHLQAIRELAARHAAAS